MVLGLLDGIDQARGGAGRVVFLGPEAADEDVTWSDFLAEAERTAAWLQSVHGVGPGSRVVVLASPSRAMVTAMVAVWLAGGAITCAPTPARTDNTAGYARQTRDRIAALGDPLVLLGAPYDAFAPILTAGGVPTCLLAEAMTASPGGAWKRPDVTPADPALLQFTAGATGAPKIVQITHGNLAANIAAVKERMRHDDIHGRLLSWLPLAHDLGLLGALALYLTCGHCDVLFGAPRDYLASPASWLTNAARYRATMLFGPASAYAMAGRLLALGPKLDLSSVNVAICGGEQIEPAAIERFLDAAASHGFDRNSFLPLYGLAEATMAVTIPSTTGLRVDEIDADVLAERRTALPIAATGGTRARRLLRLGPALPGLRVRIVDRQTGAERAEREIGEIHVRGPSIAAGYLTAGTPTAGTPTAGTSGTLGTPGTPSASTEAVPDHHLGGESAHRPDGWLDTGDLGYLVDGELVVCGRARDLITLGGRDLHPEEVEQAVSRVPGVRPGNAVAFPVSCPDGTGISGLGIRGLGVHGLGVHGLGIYGLGIAFEVRAGRSETDIRAEVIAAVVDAVGIRPIHVQVLPPGSIPKTPSGKPQRFLAAETFGGATSVGLLALSRAGSGRGRLRT